MTTMKRRSRVARWWIQASILGVSTVFLSAPAAAQGPEPTPQSREEQAASIERQIHLDGGRALSICAQAASIGQLSEGLLEGSAGRAVLDRCARPSTPLTAQQRAEGQRAVFDEIERRRQLTTVCGQRDVLTPWLTQQQQLASSTPRPPTAVDPDIARELSVGIQALGDACQSDDGAARSGVRLTRQRLTYLNSVARILGTSSAGPEQARAIEAARPSIRGGGGSVAATAAAADPTTAFVSMALEGIAQFLQNRARAEIQLMLIDRIREQMCGEQQPSRTFLTSTCAFLGPSSDFFAPTFGPSFVAAVADDALHLPRSFGRYMQDHASTFPGVGGLVLRGGLELVATLAETTDVSTNATAVRTAVVDWRCNGDASCTRWQAILRVGLTAVDGFARSDDSPAQREILYGALQQLVTTLGVEMPLNRERFDALAGRVRELRAQLQALHEAPDREARAARVEPVASAVISMVNESMDVADPDRAHPRLPGSLSGFFGAIARRSVADAVTQSLRVSLDLIAVVNATNPTNPTPTIPIPPDAIRVLTFGADLAAATSADQVSAALESFSSPVGSWRMKARSSFALSLNGAFGIAGGWESADPPSSGGDRTDRGFGQLFAPVGLDFAFGRRTFHWGFFVPVIDVGALAPVGGAREEARRFSPMAFIAPGLFLRFGFAHNPLIFGVGASYHPFAHIVAPVGGGSEQVNSAVTVSAFLAIDIPIFTFHARPISPDADDEPAAPSVDPPATTRRRRRNAR